MNTIALRAPGRVEMEDTDHKFRTDTREVIAIDGHELWPPRSVDGLPYNLHMDEQVIRTLLDIYFGCV
jgi:hypothetical protein